MLRLLQAHRHVLGACVAAEQRFQQDSRRSRALRAGSHHPRAEPATGDAEGTALNGTASAPSSSGVQP